MEGTGRNETTGDRLISDVSALDSKCNNETFQVDQDKLDDLMFSTNSLASLKINVKQKRRRRVFSASFSQPKFTDSYKYTNDLCLGCGSYGSVYQCSSRGAGSRDDFAVKIIEKKGHSRTRLFHEVEILHQCKGHPNIVQLNDLIEEEDRFYLVFEKLNGGPLLDHIAERQGKRGFSELEASLVVKDIANALDFLHDKGIAHRDLKPANILCTNRHSANPVKICDFDLASAPWTREANNNNNNNNNNVQCATNCNGFLSESSFVDTNSLNLESPMSDRAFNDDLFVNAGGSRQGVQILNRNNMHNQSENNEGIYDTEQLSSPVGSAEYMAPEVVNLFIGGDLGAAVYDKRCDLWSLGVIMYIILCGYAPFYGSCGQDCGWDEGVNCEDCQALLMASIQRGEVTFREAQWASISEEAKHLLRHLLEKDVSKRFTAKQVLAHPWLKLANHGTALDTPGILIREKSTGFTENVANNIVAEYRNMSQCKKESAVSENLTFVNERPRLGTDDSGFGDQASVDSNKTEGRNFLAEPEPEPVQFFFSEDESPLFGESEANVMEFNSIQVGLNNIGSNINNVRKPSLGMNVNCGVDIEDFENHAENMIMAENENYFPGDEDNFLMEKETGNGLQIENGYHGCKPKNDIFGLCGGNGRQIAENRIKPSNLPIN